MVKSPGNSCKPMQCLISDKNCSLSLCDYTTSREWGEVKTGNCTLFKNIQFSGRVWAFNLNVAVGRGACWRRCGLQCQAFTNKQKLCWCSSFSIHTITTAVTPNLMSNHIFNETLNVQSLAECSFNDVHDSEFSPCACLPSAASTQDTVLFL